VHAELLGVVGECEQLPATQAERNDRGVATA
jgi:hypothetical protein